MDWDFKKAAVSDAGESRLTGLSKNPGRSSKKPRSLFKAPCFTQEVTGDTSKSCVGTAQIENCEL